MVGPCILASRVHIPPVPHLFYWVYVSRTPFTPTTLALAGTNNYKQRHQSSRALPITTSSDWSNRRRATRWTLVFITARVIPHRFFLFTSHLNHDRQAPATKGPGQGHLRTEYGHRRPEHRQGGHEHHTSKPRLWVRRPPSDHDPSESPSLSRRDVPFLHATRTRWPTNRITLILGYPALISARLSNEEWTGRH